MVLAGRGESRVTYWEPSRVAKLPATGTSDARYLKTDMDSGHAGASGRFDALKETALG